MRKSQNYKQIASGNAYPLFYDTLFATLRATLAAAAVKARANGKGLWASDDTSTGVSSRVGQLETDGVVFPKLFRRLIEFDAVTASAPASQFLAWLATKHEQVLDLDTGNFTHFDNVVAVARGQARLTQVPERLVFVSDKGRQRPNPPH